jgi:acyl dehydratase
MVDAEWKLTAGTWEDAEALVGKEISSSAGIDPVNTPDIRRRLEVLAWDSPIHRSDEAARSVGYERAVSPVTMNIVWCLPAYWEAGDARPQVGDPVLMPNYPFPRIPAPGTALFAAGCRTRYFAPMYAGERISSRSILLSVTRKRLTIGDGAFMVVRTDYTKSGGVLVSVEDMTVFRYTPEVGAA